MKQVLGIVGLALTVALPLAAQQPGNPTQGAGPAPRTGARWHGHAWGGRGEMARRGGEMVYAPERLLARNGELQLTAQQMTALTAIRDASRRSAQTAMEQSRRHMDELKAALDANAPDTAAVRTHFLAAHEGMGQARLAMLMAGARAKAVLTDAQRAQVAAWKDRRPGNRWGPQRGTDQEGGPPPGPPGR
jgi:Spy/CpxP family protein refolding chaperone